MLDVLTTGCDAHLSELVGAGEQLQDRFRFIQACSEGRHSSRERHLDCSNHPQVLISDAQSGAPFHVRKDRGAMVSTWAMGGQCQYAQVETGAYLLLCSLLGLVQWRALQLNPLLEEYDFIHRCDCPCLYRAIPHPEDFALLLEDPHLCRNCVAFYNCLGVEPEVAALAGVSHRIRTMADKRSVTP
jgi:hypothetical protein